MKTRLGSGARDEQRIEDGSFTRKTASLLCLALLAFSPTARAAESPPNVVIVNIDDIGPAWLPPYARRLDPSTVEDVICRMYAARHAAQGRFDLAKHLEAARTSMPFLDTLASQGAVFDWCFSTASICAPSRAGLLTGRYQERWGGYSIPDIQAVGIPAGVPCLAEPFARAGYLCGIVGKWHVGIRDPAIWQEAEKRTAGFGAPGPALHRAVVEMADELGYDTSCAPGQSPLDKGFAYYFGYNRHASQYYEADDLWENRSRVPKRPPGEFLTDLFNAKAAAFVERALRSNRHFLLYYAPMAMHARLVPPPRAYSDRFHTGIAFSDQYAGHLLAVDEGIRRIFGLLRTYGQDRDTLFFLTADNGMSLEGVPPYNAPFRGGKGSGWLGGSHEPLIVYWPGHVRPTVSNALVSELDILPTALDSAGLAAPEPVDGRSLLPLLGGAPGFVPHQRLFSAGLHAANWAYPYFPIQGLKVADQATCPMYVWELTRNELLMRVTAVRPGVYDAFPRGRPAQTLAFDLKSDLTELHNAFRLTPEIKTAEESMDDWLRQTLPPAAIHRDDYQALRQAAGPEPSPQERSDLDVN